MKRTFNILGHGRYAVSEHQQFVDRKGNLVRVIRDQPTKPIPVGEAYAFFDCSSTKGQIAAEFSDLREHAQSPKELELYLMNSSDVYKSVNPDSKLGQIAEDAVGLGYKYAIKAYYPGASNLKTANKLVAILNRAYLSPLFKEGEEFKGGIFYMGKNGYNHKD